MTATAAAILGFALGAVLAGGVIGFAWWNNWGWSRNTIALAWLVYAFESDAPIETRCKAHEQLVDELTVWGNQPRMWRYIRELRERLEGL